MRVRCFFKTIYPHCPVGETPTSDNQGKGIAKTATEIDKRQY